MLREIAASLDQVARKLTADAARAHDEDPERFPALLTGALYARRGATAAKEEADATAAKLGELEGEPGSGGQGGQAGGTGAKGGGGVARALLAATDLLGAGGAGTGAPGAAPAAAPAGKAPPEVPTPAPAEVHPPAPAEVRAPAPAEAPGTPAVDAAVDAAPVTATVDGARPDEVRQPGPDGLEVRPPLPLSPSWAGRGGTGAPAPAPTQVGPDDRAPHPEAPLVGLDGLPEGQPGTGPGSGRPGLPLPTVGPALPEPDKGIDLGPGGLTEPGPQLDLPAPTIEVPRLDLPPAGLRAGPDIEGGGVIGPWPAGPQPDGGIDLGPGGPLWPPGPGPGPLLDPFPKPVGVPTLVDDLAG